MSYLSRLAARAVKASNPVELRPRSRFEPLAGKGEPAPLEVEAFVESPGQNRTFTTHRQAPASPWRAGAAHEQGVDRARRGAGKSLEEQSEIQVAVSERPSTPAPPIAAVSPTPHAAAVSRASVREREATSEDSLVEPADRLVDSVDRSPLHSRPGIGPAPDQAAPRRLDAEPAFIAKAQATNGGDARETRDGLPVAEETLSVAGESPHEDRPAERTDSDRAPSGERERLDEPTVTVRIGRIDVRASLPAPAGRPSAQPPIETLDEYMRRTATRR